MHVMTHSSVSLALQCVDAVDCWHNGRPACKDGAPVICQKFFFLGEPGLTRKKGWLKNWMCMCLCDPVFLTCYNFCYALLCVSFWYVQGSLQHIASNYRVFGTELMVIWTVLHVLEEAASVIVSESSLAIRRVSIFIVFLYTVTSIATLGVVFSCYGVFNWWVKFINWFLHTSIQNIRFAKSVILFICV